MPQDFTLTAGSSDGFFSLSATVSATFIGHDYSNSNTYRIDTLEGLVNGNQIASFVHDDRVEIQDYYTANNIDTQEIDGFDKLVFTDFGGVRYSISTLFQGRNAYFEIDSRDSVYGRTIGVQVTAVCFAQGTLIRTLQGEISVERLKVGDLALTATGAYRPIKWLGHRAVDCSRAASLHEVMPVRIAANAFGDNRPARDLLVSPGHAICVDLLGELLIPAASLVNGATIVQEDVDSVTYWHVELDSHDVILAENLPCESYLEMGNRNFFANGGVVALDASPDAPVPTHADFCRPFHAEGELVDLVRQRLVARAAMLGWSLQDEPLAGLHLIVDGMRLEPQVRGLAARFTLPAGARDVWLVSRTSVPAEVGASSADRRALGVYVDGLSIDDGFGMPRHVVADDPRLCIGFHDVERTGDGRVRWTAGRAKLPMDLWDGIEGAFFLRLDLAGPALPRWVAPTPVLDAPIALAA